MFCLEEIQMTDIRKFMNKNMHWVTLLLAALCAIATVGLVVYRNGGIFTYYGDYNCQQICFYMHAHELVKSGQIGWDWVTDLGVNFIGSYSFYLLFSPFFWLTLPFDTAVPLSYGSAFRSQVLHRSVHGLLFRRPFRKGQTLRRHRRASLRLQRILHL